MVLQSATLFSLSIRTDGNDPNDTHSRDHADMPSPPCSGSDDHVIRTRRPVIATGMVRWWTRASKLVTDSEACLAEHHMILLGDAAEPKVQHYISD